MSRSTERRVLVTGIGCISALADALTDTWNALLAGNLALQGRGLDVIVANAECIGGLPRIVEAYAEMVKCGSRRISPFFLPAAIININSGNFAHCVWLCRCMPVFAIASSFAKTKGREFFFTCRMPFFRRQKVVARALH